MKRDMDLCRRLLQAIEDQGETKGERVPWPQVSNGDHPDIIGHHVWLLWKAELIEGFDVTTRANEFPIADVRCLTWAGHEFLANAADDSKWNKAKALVAEKSAGFSFQVLGAVLRHLAEQALGIQV
jgi:hypothetical protein